MLKKSFSVLLIFIFLCTYFTAMPILSNADPIIDPPPIIICADPPAGIKTVIEDTNDGFVSVSLKLRGEMNINSFSWAIKYDKSKVVPVTVADKVDAPSSKLATAVAIAPYYSLTAPGSTMTLGWSISSFQIENTTAAATGNYFLIGYAKNTGVTFSLADANEST